jgi:hypothetical protein
VPWFARRDSCGPKHKGKLRHANSRRNRDLPARPRRSATLSSGNCAHQHRDSTTLRVADGTWRHGARGRRNVDDLVDRAKAGDSTALNELLVAMRPRAMAAALRILHNPDDAEDAVQDAFLKVWRCLAAFEGRASFSTWLHRIVSNASLDLAAQKFHAARKRQSERIARTWRQRTASPC